MFAYLKGTVEFLGDSWIAVEVNGVGYKVFVPTSVFNKLGPLGTKIKIYTYTHVREDEITIYGFSSIDEERLFQNFISISGIGPRVALNILSFADPIKLSMAVAGADMEMLTAVPGIGKKTAQRIILELRDKMNIEDLIQSEKEVGASEDISAFREAINALISLGYSGIQAKNALDVVRKSDMTTEELIKAALKRMAD